MNIESNKPPKFFHTAKALFVFVALQLPVIGHCDSGNGWFNIFGTKGKNMKEVATKVATLNVDNEIWGLDFSPDGKHLAATSPNTRQVYVWDWRIGRRIAQSLEKQGSDLTTTEPLRYSPNGHLLVWCGGTIARIWNTETWEVIHTIDGTGGVEAAGGGCNVAGFAPDGKSLALVLYRNSNRPGDNLIVYDTSTWQPVWGLRTILPFNVSDSERKRANAEGTAFDPNTLAMSPDGKQLALGGEVWADSFFNAEIKIVDIEKRAIAKTIKAFSNPVELGESVARLAWNPDGTQITAGIFGVNKDGGDAVRIFNVQDGEQVANEPASLGTQIRGLRYTPDGKYLLEAGIGHSLEIWDGKHQKLLQEISEGGVVESVAVSADGQYFAIGIRDDRKVQVWKLK